MRWRRLLSTVPLRLRSLLRTREVERDLDDEIRDHLERRIEAGVESGMSRDDARRAALRAFGGIEQRKEECRDTRRVSFVEQRIRDLRFAVRQLVRDPGFACTAIAVLALGLAGSMSIFGFVDAALIEPLPYRESSRLVTVFGTHPDVAPAQRAGMVSYLDFLDWRARTRSFESIAAYDVRGGFTVQTPSGPQGAPGLRVTSGFFRTLGVTPVLGREFAPDEEGRSAPPTVMLSYGAWQTRFGGSPDVIGRTVTLQSAWLPGAEPHVVIGVLPADFHFTLAAHAEFWATIRRPQSCWNVRSCSSLQAIGRLADGVSDRAAMADMNAILEQLRLEHPDHHPEPVVSKLLLLRDVMLGDIRPILVMFLGGAVLLLVIACVNIVSMLLARTDSRTREIAVRHALGASSGRLAVQFATEACVLVAIGAGLGFVLAAWGMQLLAGLLSDDLISRLPYFRAVGMNPRVIGFGCMVSVIAAAAFALVPVTRAPASVVPGGFNEAGRGGAGMHWQRLGSQLVTVQLAVAALLLADAGLLGRSLYRLLRVDPGFNAQGLVTFFVTPTSAQAAPGGDGTAANERPGALARHVAARLAALPGVDSAGYADLLPFASGLAPTSSFWIPGRPENEQRKESWPVRRVSAGYFEALQARLMRGRFFTEDEVDSARLVLLINETAAKRYFPGENPIGRSIAFGGAASPTREIIGIVADIKDGPPETPAHPSAYVPFEHSAFVVVVRSTRPDAVAFQPLAAAVREIRPDAFVGQVTTMTDRLNRLPSATLQRISTWLVGGFAAMALVLSVVGLYGVVAYSVGQRTREIGVRMALGAQRGSVYRLVMAAASWPIGLGTSLGLIGAVTAATLMRHLFAGMEASDALTLVATAVVVSVSAVVATYIPARRAASVNPIEVLRVE